MIPAEHEEVLTVPQQGYGRNLGLKRNKSSVDNSFHVHALINCDTTRYPIFEGLLDLVAEHEGDGLDVLSSSIDVISEEEVVGLGWEALLVEDPQQISVLKVQRNSRFSSVPFPLSLSSILAVCMSRRQKLVML